VSATGTSKISASEVELQNTIIRAGFIPVKRDSDYNQLKTLIFEGLDRDLTAPVPKQY
jgi:2-iminoacetate synthase ThiH